MCSVLPQALQGGIIRVLKTQFLVLNKNFRFCVANNFSEVIPCLFAILVALKHCKSVPLLAQ